MADIRPLRHGLDGAGRKLYANEPLAIDLDATVFAHDSTTIDLCLARFPWTPSQKSKAAVKMHVLLNLRGSIPEFIVISDGKTHDVLILDQMRYDPGAYYVMDRGYVGFKRLYRLHQNKAFFVTRTKRRMRFAVVESIWQDNYNEGQCRRPCPGSDAGRNGRAIFFDT